MLNREFKILMTSQVIFKCLKEANHCKLYKFLF